MSAAQILREAAALMRERADLPSPSPWSWRITDDRTWAEIHDADGPPEDGGFLARLGDDDTAAHIASWHPAVALAVAQLLDDQAALIEQHGDFSDIEAMGDANALAVAHAYLSTQDTP